MTFDEKLAQALGETFDERMERRMAVSKKHRFSLSYRLWEYRTLKNLRRNHHDKHWTLRRARHIVTAAAVAVSSLLLGITVYAAIAMGRYSFDTKPDYSKMFIEKQSSDKTSIEKYYGLPEEEGWEIVDFNADGTGTMINYKCGEKKITFCQDIIHEGNMGNINTEKADIEPISLYTENDGFILYFREEWCSIYWIYDGYLLNLSGNITKSETVNLAYSTKAVDF